MNPAVAGRQAVLAAVDPHREDGHLDLVEMATGRILHSEPNAIGTWTEVAGARRACERAASQADWQVVLDTTVPAPVRGRTYSTRRRVRLSDMDSRGRFRLDAVARFLQDVAIDDVQETGCGMPEHLWFVRRIRIDVLRPFLEDREIELTTWCSGVAAIAAGRRWSVAGDAGGRIEVDSVWIHLDAGAGPARIENFGIYTEAAGGRRVSTKLELPDPPAGGARRRWSLRATDVDLHGHVNNAVYWQAVEELAPVLGIDPGQPVRAELDYRQPIDFGEEVGLVTFDDEGRKAVAFVADGAEVRAVARIGPPAR
jgi:acyl-ACP thioesterase